MSMKVNKFAAVFPGQGSQKFGMGLDFFQEYSIARDVFEKASNSIDIDLKEICFTENLKLNQTEFTQPALLATELAMYLVIQDMYPIEFDLFAGHSLGEYTALCAAGVFELEDAVRIVRSRGKLMQTAVPVGVGAMSALVGDNIIEKEIPAIIKECGAEIANINTTNQIVISGRKESVLFACEKCQNMFPTITVFPLLVSAPFHCSLLKPIEYDFLDFLKSIPINSLKATKVLSNYTGDFHKPDEVIANLVNQICREVMWIKNMRLIQESSLQILEIGPGKTLSRFFGTINLEIKSIFNVRAMKNAFSEYNDSYSYT